MFRVIQPNFSFYFPSQRTWFQLKVIFCFHCTFNSHTVNSIHILLNMRYRDRNQGNLETTTYYFLLKHKFTLSLTIHLFKNVQDGEKKINSIDQSEKPRRPHWIDYCNKRDHTLSFIIKKYVFKHVQDGKKNLVSTDQSKRRRQPHWVAYGYKRDHSLSLIIKQHVFNHVQDGNKA